MTDLGMFRQRPGSGTPSMSGVKPLARFARLIVAYNLAVILWGAYVRASGSGSGCGSRWPLCNGEVLPSTTQSQTLIEFMHRATSVVSLMLVSLLVAWCWKRTSKADWPRYSIGCGLLLLLNEAFLGALLVLFGHVGLDRSAVHALFLCLHLGNTLLLLAALALTARWLSNGERRFVVVAKPHEWIAIGLGLVSVMVIGMTGSLAGLGDTIFPVGSLKQALTQDFSSSSHTLLRLRLLHPVAAVMGSLYVLWLLWNFWGKQERLRWTLVLAVMLTAQLAIGATNVILLAPGWLQVTHLLVADLFWILLVLASAELLFAEQHFGVPDARRSTRGATRRLDFKGATLIGSWLKKLCDGEQEGTSAAK